MWCLAWYRRSVTMCCTEIQQGISPLGTQAKHTQAKALRVVCRPAPGALAVGGQGHRCWPNSEDVSLSLSIPDPCLKCSVLLSSHVLASVESRRRAQAPTPTRKAWDGQTETCVITEC